MHLFQVAPPTLNHLPTPLIDCTPQTTYLRQLTIPRRAKVKSFRQLQCEQSTSADSFTAPADMLPISSGEKLPKVLWMKTKRSTDMPATPAMVRVASTMNSHSTHVRRWQLRT